MKKIPKSAKKFISREKSKIRQKFFEEKKQREEIEALYKKLNINPEAKNK
jgi:membrane protein insertase Oxa1/YidC/SpoIIIJ